MNTDVVNALSKLKPIDFTDAQYLPKAIGDPSKYTTVTISSKTARDASCTVNIDHAQICLLDSINNTVKSYQTCCSKYHIYIQNLFGIMEGNLDLL